MITSWTITCASPRVAQVLSSLLVKQGVQIRQPDEAAFLSVVASGDLDQIEAAVAQLRNESPRSGPITFAFKGEPGNDRTPEAAGAPEPAQGLEPAQEAEPAQAPEPPLAPGPEPPASLELALESVQPEPLPPLEPASGAPPPEPAPMPEPAEEWGPPHEAEPAQAAEPPHEAEPPQAAEPPESPAPAPTAERPEPLLAPEAASEGQRWVVVYEDGMSLTTASERMAHGLAEAERQRGCRVTVQRLDNAETHPRGVGKPAHPPL